MNVIRFKILYYKFILKYFGRFTSPFLYNKILKLEGFDVGEGTIFYGPESILLDRQRPWMLKIGKYCKITSGVSILTHDYSRSVLRRAYGEILGEAAMTTIGDNVFIGINSIILMGAQVGNNVIIGAGSVVGGKIPDDVVIAGNPAKVVRTLEEHYQKRKGKTLTEAKVWVNSYKYRFGRYPSEGRMGPFFPLFTNRDTFDYDNDNRLLCLGDNMEEVVRDFKNSKPQFESFSEFMSYINEEGNDNGNNE